jgi:hypothetical protein
VKLNLKILSIIIIVVLIISSTYVIFFTNEENVDDDPPEIINITGNISGQKGDIINIQVTFSDNIAVTSAILYFRTVNDNEWISNSILNGSMKITLDSNSNLNYYVTVDDKAGNGPVGNPSADGSSYYTITVHEDENNDNEYIRYTFVEEGAGTNCKFCPIIAKWLYELYSSGDYNFYFVTLVDKNQKAADRLYDEYNLWGLPTVFIDGGYNVLLGGGHEKSEYAQAIRDAELRKNVPDIQLTVEAEYDNNSEELICNVIVKNKEDATYNGQLRVYLTEKISRWSGSEGDPYHFGFLEYLIDEEISINANENATFQEIRDISDLDPENLMAIGAVFNSEKKQGFSDPPYNKYPFDVYYVDAADGSELLSGGNLPPSVGFSLPKVGYLHVMGIPIWDFILHKRIVLIGRTKIVAEAYDDTGIEKVEFYIDEKLVSEDTEAPYEYSFRKVKLFKRFVRKHTISVIAYDDGGKTGTNSIEIWGFLL